MADFQMIPDEIMQEFIDAARARKRGGGLIPGNAGVNKIIGAFNAGKDVVMIGEDGQTVDFDWNKLGDMPEGMTNEEQNAWLNAVLQSSALEAQMKDSQAATGTLQSYLERMLSDPAMQALVSKVGEYTGKEIPYPSTYKTDSSAVNAWANKMQRGNAADAQRRGIAGSREVMARDTDINMKRGSALDDAYVRDEAGQAQWKSGQRQQNVSFLSNLFGAKASPMMSIANAISNIYANRQFAAPATISLPAKDSGTYLSFGGANTKKK